MTLRIYNTLTKAKEEFRPLDPKNVRVYVCGPTVYDFAHIGNARPAIVFDVLFRLLRHLYGKEHVTYVRNITDVDDKINARALRDYPGVPLNDAIRKVTETTYDQYQKDVAALGCLPPTSQPRATEHIAGMIEMIKVLIAKGHAYEAGGEVLFDVSSMPDYGKLSGRKLEEQQAGARVAVEAHKKNPGDFVLWKLSTTEEPGWDSPWGRGRPGWHIECSVMSKDALGEVFDIHGGGLDLIFPHHENEIAQSRCAHGTKVMANYWMHNGFLQVEGQKMSKSLGNFVTINELLQRSTGAAMRYVMLQTHYRLPIDWRSGKLEVARRVLQSWGRTLSNYASQIPQTSIRAIDDEVINFLQDDLNTSAAITDRLSSLHSMAKVDLEACRKFRDTLELLGFVGIDKYRQFDLGVSAYVPPDKDELVDDYEMNIAKFRTLQANGMFEESATVSLQLAQVGIGVGINKLGGVNLFFEDKDSKEEQEKIEKLIADRNIARIAKNWKESDRIRDELLAMGIQIKDNKDGTTSWEVKR